MNFSVITLFPELFSTFVESSLIGRAIQEGKAGLDLVDLRDFGTGKHKQVDDTVFGGGDGMLIQCEPVFSAFEYLRDSTENFKFSISNFKKEKEKRSQKKIRHVFLTPQGERLTQRKVEELTEYDEIVLLCGRYEGVDQRVRDELIDEEISLGDFVLTGGELPAMVLMDSVIRILPGVLGKEGSHQFDSFSKEFDGKKEYPQYTKPADFKGLKVPDVLMSGHHAEIEKWRRAHLR
jgi:tRNA (guanine37-N1)-methyltransferase